jgi:hypothetical protein
MHRYTDVGMYILGPEGTYTRMGTYTSYTWIHTFRYVWICTPSVRSPFGLEMTYMGIGSLGWYICI